MVYFCHWRFVFKLSKQCRPWWNSSGSSLFAIVLVLGLVIITLFTNYSKKSVITSLKKKVRITDSENLIKLPLLSSLIQVNTVCQGFWNINCGFMLVSIAYFFSFVWRINGYTLNLARLTNKFCPENLPCFFFSCIYSNAYRLFLIMKVNTMNPNQTAPKGAFWSGSILCAI